MRFGYDYNISIIKIGFSYSFLIRCIIFLLIANKKLLDRGLIFLGVD